MVSLAAAWREGRETRTRRTGTPILVKLVRAAARALPTWRRARTATMQVAAFGFLDYAAFQWHSIVGYVAIGVSLLVLEALGSSGAPGGGRR